MSLAEILDSFARIHPYTSFALGGVALIGTAVGSYFYGRFTMRIESVVERRSIKEVTFQPTRVVEESKPRTLREALDTPGVRSTVTGRVERWNLGLDGYSGTLIDDSGKAPFHFCECVMDSDGVEIIPEILADSLDNKTPIILGVETTDVNPRLRVQSIAYEMNGKKYNF